MATSNPTRDVRGELLRLSREGQARRRIAFAAVLAGERPRLDDLAARAGVAVAQVRDVADRGVITLDANERLVGAAGLSLVPMRQHRLTLGDRTFWTWCAVDVVSIPAALGTDATAETTCHHCGAPVRVALHGGQVTGSSHPDARLWNAEHGGGSLAGGTCGLMNLVRTPAHLDAWRAAHPDARGEVLDLAQTAETGRTWWGALLEGRADAACCAAGTEAP